MTPNKQGILYISTGKKYLEETRMSAVSVKKHMPELPIALVTNAGLDAGFPFDEIIPMGDRHSDVFCMDKVDWLSASPFDQTLYLDSDTYTVAPFFELFDLLSHFDFAAAHGSFRSCYPLDNVPDSYPEFQAGILLYRKSEEIDNLWRTWKTLFEDHLGRNPPPPHDQPSLREALYFSNIRIATLTPEFNCRYTDPGFVSGKVKILHGRSNSSKVAEHINRSTDMRAHVIDNEDLQLLTSPGCTLPWHRKVKRVVQKEGVFGLLKRIIK